MAQDTMIVRAQEVLSYLEEIVRMGNKTIDRLEEHNEFLLYQTELPNVQNIKLDIDFFQLEAEFLTVERPVLPAPPPLPETLEGWVEVPNDPDQKLRVHQVRQIKTEDQHINFADDPERVVMYRKYLDGWRFWAESQAEKGNPFAKFLQAPVLPPELQGWIKTSDNPAVEPERILSRVLKGEVSHSIEIAFAQSPERVEALEAYQEAWDQWVETIHPQKVALKLYDKLFRVRRELEYSEDLELVLGYGLVLWKRDGQTVKYPLVTQNMLIQHNAKQNRLVVVTPDEFQWQLETDPLLGLIGQDVNLRGVGTAFREVDFLETEEHPLRGVLQQAAALHAHGQVIGSQDADTTSEEAQQPSLTPTEELRVLDGWALFVRKKNQHALIEDIHAFLELLRQKECQLPPAIAKLVADPAETSQDWSGGTDHTEWSALLDQKILFPKPANQEQIKIVDSLEQSDGVVVQGPPGTGKSHTIANLIAHYMAHGQRVLVTSQKDQALKVLHQMLPEFLQPLCMPILKNDSQRKQKLEQAVDMITDIVTNRSPAQLEREVIELSDEFESKRRDIEAVSKQLQQLAAAELPVRTPYKPQAMLPAMAARVIQEEADDYSWFRDRPSYHTEQERQVEEQRDVIQLYYKFPLSDEEMETLAELRRELLPKLGDLAHYRLPKSQKLLKPERFVQMAEGLANLDQLSRKAEQHYPNLLLRKKGEGLDEVIALLRQGVEALQLIDNTWAKKFLGLAREFKDKLADSLAALEPQFKNLEHLYSRLDLLKDVYFHPDIDLREYREYVAEAVERLEAGKNPLGLRNMIGGKKKAAIQALAVNGQEPETVGDWKQIVTQLEFQIAVNAFCYSWSALSKAFSETYQIPPLTRESGYQELKDSYLLLRKAFDYQFYLKPRIQKVLTQVVVGDETRMAQELDAEMERLYEALKLKRDELRYADVLLQYQQARDYLLALSEEADIHPMVEELLECLSEDLGQVQEYAPKWEVHYQRIVALEKMFPTFEKFNKLCQRLAKEAPEWTKVWQDPEVSEREMGSSFWKEAWDYAVLNGYLDEINQREVKQTQLENLLDLYQKALNKLKAKLIIKKTELGLIEKITDANVVSLKKWKNAIKKLGKGTGKYASAYRKEALQHMQDARNAVPVWIMPVFDVSEIIGREFGYFDVVIVDEASQCDLKSLLVLFRAKKVIIVGDDQQISPSAVGVNKEQMTALIRTHLKQFPHASMMELETSLYDLAQIVFNSRANIMLKEHFRCVPEIIQFSNQLCYNDHIQPLRNPPDSLRLEPTLQNIFVHGGYREERRQVNKPEAEAICEKVQELVADPRYAGKTIGVISLTGSEQAKYILDIIDQYVPPRQQEAHAFHAGDAYAFQGDERDVIILSMVVGKVRRFNAISSATYLQRYNVAVSRAKDQLILFHSVELGVDLTNPEDLRYQLLKFVQRGWGYQEQPKQLLDCCDTLLEEDVYRWLRHQGYSVTPQVQVGQYRIDLVVEGEKDRLALECEGDQYQSPERWWAGRMGQRQLERVGWIFHRVSGAQFYRDPEATMQPIIELLDQMKVFPQY